MVTVTGQNLVIDPPLPIITSLRYYDTTSASYKDVPDPSTDPTGFKAMFGTAPSGLSNNFDYKPTFDVTFTKEDALNYEFTTLFKCKFRVNPSYVEDRYYSFTSSSWSSDENYGWSVIDQVPINTASIEAIEVYSIQFRKLTRLLMSYIPV